MNRKYQILLAVALGASAGVSIFILKVVWMATMCLLEKHT